MHLNKKIPSYIYLYSNTICSCCGKPEIYNTLLDELVTVSTTVLCSYCGKPEQKKGKCHLIASVCVCVVRVMYMCVRLCVWFCVVVCVLVCVWLCGLCVWLSACGCVFCVCLL